jgi:hypothetical protein
MLYSCFFKIRNSAMKTPTECQVMLQTKQLDATTASQRAAIAASHDRNRVLERQDDLSPAALKWISAPLAFKPHAALAAKPPGSASQPPPPPPLLPPPLQPAAGVVAEALGGSATAVVLAALSAARVDFSDFEAAALAHLDAHDTPGQAVTSRGLLTQPLVLKVVHAWKQRRRRELLAAPSGVNSGERGSGSSGRSGDDGGAALSLAIHAQRQLRAASLFSRHQPPCTAAELNAFKQHAAQYRAPASRGCQTPEELKRERDLHGPQHQQKFPDYIHFVHVPKVRRRRRNMSWSKNSEK